MNGQSIPNHIGIIMDGNRRWAKQHGLSSLLGHKKGLDKLVEMVELADRKGIKFLTAYAFSTENWHRDKKELNYLMTLTLKAFDKYLNRLHHNAVRLVLIGSYDGVVEAIATSFKQAVQLTSQNSGITLGICFNYGGQMELVDAFKKMMLADINPQAISVDTIADYLYAPFIPPIDILVRTSGEKRISNFMLWRIAYSELYFIDKLWPDFDNDDLDNVIGEYANRQRRFGA